MDNNFVEKFDLKQCKKFLTGCVGHKYECFYKLIMAYQISRLELLNLEWKDIDFNKGTITIYPVTYKKIYNKLCYDWSMEKVEKLKRVFPLLPNLKKLLLEEKQRQLNNAKTIDNYDSKNANYLCLKNNGERLNANTLSRNIKYITKDNDLPDILLSDLKMSLDDFIEKNTRNYDYYRCWTRFDIIHRKENCYGKFDFYANKTFIKKFDDFINCGILDKNAEM